MPKKGDVYLVVISIVALILLLALIFSITKVRLAGKAVAGVDDFSAYTHNVFVTNNVFEADIIYGQNAPASEVAAAEDVRLGMQKEVCT